MGKIKKKPADKAHLAKVNQGGIQKKKKTKKPFKKMNGVDKIKNVSLVNQIKDKPVIKARPNKKKMISKTSKKSPEKPVNKASPKIGSSSENGKGKPKHDKRPASPVKKTKAQHKTQASAGKKQNKNQNQDNAEELSEEEDKYKNMSVAEFLASCLADEIEASEEEEEEEQDEMSESDEEDGNDVPIPGLEESDLEESEQEEEEVKSEEQRDDSESEEQSGDEVEAHKKSLAKLKETDPDFFKFLEEEDEFDLLKFGSSDEDQQDDVGGDDDDDDDEKDEDDVHKATTELEVASDESDFEGEEEDEDEDEEGALKKVKGHGKITQNMLKAWEANIEADKSNKTMAALVDAFHAALLTVSGEDEDVVASSYQVEGSAIFNGVIRMCVTHLGPAFLRFLGISEDSKLPHAPHKYKKFIKIKKMMQLYLTDLTKLLAGVTSANIQSVLLKHLLYISGFLVSFPNATKAILKRLVQIWGGAEESVRVLAFFCILRITNAQRLRFLETVLKSMYITYVKNSKFVSVNNLAGINFMRRSLVELFALDVNVAYQLVFMYIRQLAIHLRNAITLKKKENIQAVYNWQYINSLKLWGNLLSVTVHKPQLHQLIYPFVQVALATIKLVPTPQYYPLRFHVVQMLVELSNDTGVFIPVLPFLLEVLTSYNFNKKHQKVSMRPVAFTGVLRASKSQMLENGFKDAVIERVYALMLEYMANNSSSIAFPDLSLVCSVQLRDFLKNCRNVSYKRKLKQVQEKIKQNADFVEEERKKVTLNIKDFQLIEGWEAQLKAKGTPLSTFFESWNKVHSLKKNKEATDNKKLGDYKLPKLKKRKGDDKKRNDDNDGPLELFPSDSEEEPEVTMEGKRKRGNRGKGLKKFADKSGPVQDTGEKDMVQDLDVDDW